MDCCIETHGLTKTFGTKQAVAGIDLRVDRGSFYGFLGPNGAGKSTTIKMLTGLLAPTAGAANLLGLDLARNALDIKGRIGVLPEDLCLFENLTAREYLTFVGRMYQLPAPLSQIRCDELLNLLGLAETGKTLVVEFSHGMKKKLSLAAALIHDPELVFLDEPFEGIDALASRTIRAVLDRIVQRGGTIFLTSHILEVVERLCTHVGIISEGRLVHQALLDRGNGTSLEAMSISAVGESDAAPVELSWLRSGV
jgi:ABC-2 type transport system ATP-binding protein